MPHDNELNSDKGTGVGTDGSLQSPKEGFADHGADRSSEESDGVGMDGSLVNPEKDDDVRDATDPAYPRRKHRGPPDSWSCRNV